MKINITKFTVTIIVLIIVSFLSCANGLYKSNIDIKFSLSDKYKGNGKICRITEKLQICHRNCMLQENITLDI